LISRFNPLCSCHTAIDSLGYSRKRGPLPSPSSGTHFGFQRVIMNTCSGATGSGVSIAPALGHTPSGQRSSIT